MSLQERSATKRVQAARERYVARDISAPRLVVARAEDARIWDIDGRDYGDFARSLGCQNLGHGPPAVVQATHEPVDAYGISGNVIQTLVPSANSDDDLERGSDILERVVG